VQSVARREPLYVVCGENTAFSCDTSKLVPFIDKIQQVMNNNNIRRSSQWYAAVDQALLAYFPRDIANEYITQKKEVHVAAGGRVETGRARAAQPRRLRAKVKTALLTTPSRT
jgi:hypothetical protein